MSKQHLTKSDIEQLIIHLKNYDKLVSDKINECNICEEKRDNLIQTHFSIETLITTLKR